MSSVLDTVGSINGVLWSTPTFFVLTGMGVLFTLWTMFSQLVCLTHGFAVVRGKYDNPNDPGAINHFQALSAALSATIGLGNIGGVALAIAAGGPGALLWMWLIGFLGMAIKTVEITLALMYRDTSDPDDPHGGAMWVIEKTLGKKGGVWFFVARALGCIFCVTMLVSTITGGNMFQSYNVAVLTEQYFYVPRSVTGLILAVIVGAVIVGGIKRIGEVAGKIVPFMCVMYVVACFAVLILNYRFIDDMLRLVVVSALNPSEATGAFLGGTIYFAFSQGLRRALFSNEAGQGSAPIAHSAAKTDQPAREGIVGGLGPFIDTLCICTLTAMVILLSGVWNRQPGGYLDGAVTVVETASPGTYAVQGPTAYEALPPMEDGDPWNAEERFFMIGSVTAASSADTGTSRFPITGQVVADGQGGKSLRWDDVTLDPDQWGGKAGGRKLQTKDSGVYRNFEGAGLTAYAFDTQFPGLGKWLVTFASWLFAVSTMISWSYYGEQGVIYLGGKILVWPYKIVFLAFTALAPVMLATTGNLEAAMDLGTGLMLWGNAPIVLLMSYLAVREINNYRRRLYRGEFKTYDQMAQAPDAPPTDAPPAP